MIGKDLNKSADDGTSSRPVEREVGSGSTSILKKTDVAVGSCVANRHIVVGISGNYRTSPGKGSDFD